MSDSWKDCEGQVIDGRFRLIEHLGGSDHSVVFSTERGKNAPQKAAIKFVQAHPATAEPQLARWTQAAHLSHPNLLKLFENGRCHMAGMDLVYVVMEFAPENLAEFLPQRALQHGETRDMLEPFLETLTYIHGKGFLHGRIKPGNILAIEDQLKLSSDSISRIGEEQLSDLKPDAHTPPEGNNSTAADVWALGVTLVEALTQKAPDHSPEQSGGELSVADSVPQPFYDIARHCLQFDPKQRWSITEISNALNPPAKPAAPSIASSVPDPVKPAAAPKSASPSAQPGSKVAAKGRAGEQAQSATPKPTESVDPLSVPLSTVPPPPDRSAPGRSYYIVVAVLVALTLGAMLAIPRLRGTHSDSEPVAETPSQPAQSPAMKDSSSAPAKGSSKRQNATPADKNVQRTERAAAQTAENSVQPTAEREVVKRDAPSATTTSQTQIGSSGVSVDGEVLNQVMPQVSDRSRSTIHGTLRVVIKVHVDATGQVTGAEVAASPSKFFADSALQAARKWDFAPAKVSGQAVPSEWLVRFDFTQSDTKVFPAQTSPAT